MPVHVLLQALARHFDVLAIDSILDFFFFSFLISDFGKGFILLSKTFLFFHNLIFLAFLETNHHD